MKHVHQRYTQDQIRNFCRELLEQVQALPDVRAVGLAEAGPFSGREIDVPIAVAESLAESPTRGFVDRVSPHFFDSMGISLLAGRDFTFADQEGATRVAIIDETVAREFFSGVSPIGKRIGVVPDCIQFEIIGVVSPIKHESVREDVQPAVYLSILQGDRPWMPTLYARTKKDAAPPTAAIRQIFQAIDKDLPVFNVKTFERQLNESMAQDRLVTTLSGFFGSLAAMLSAIGLYGVMAYAVARRTREIGIRMALGAQSKSILWLVMRQAMLLVVIGMVIGLSGALAATRLISSLLFGLTATDPMTIALASSLMLAVAALASYVPARRAAKVDPLVALQCE